MREKGVVIVTHHMTTIYPFLLLPHIEHNILWLKVTGYQLQQQDC